MESAFSIQNAEFIHFENSEFRNCRSVNKTGGFGAGALHIYVQDPESDYESVDKKLEIPSDKGNLPKKNY